MISCVHRFTILLPTYLNTSLVLFMVVKPLKPITDEPRRLGGRWRWSGRFIGRRVVRKFKAANQTAWLIVPALWPSDLIPVNTMYFFQKDNEFSWWFLLKQIRFFELEWRNDGTPGEVEQCLVPDHLHQPNSGNDFYYHEQDGVVLPAVPKRACPLFCVSFGANHVVCGKRFFWLIIIINIISKPKRSRRMLWCVKC